MNFLEEPSHNTATNLAMDAEQTRIAARLMDGLVSLGPILGPSLEKASQLGEWWILANFKAGGQNAAVGMNPVLSESSRDTPFTPLRRSDDQFELGVTHPTTGEHYCYGGLPMGGANCSAIAGHMGAAFMYLVRARQQDTFHGKGAWKTWRDGFQ
jgi:hypothetical protein